MDFGQMIKLMVTVFISMSMEPNTKGNGKTIYSMEEG